MAIAKTFFGGDNNVFNDHDNDVDCCHLCVCLFEYIALYGHRLFVFFFPFQVTQNLNFLVRTSSELESNIVSTERIKEYAEAQTEVCRLWTAVSRHCSGHRQRCVDCGLL